MKNKTDYTEVFLKTKYGNPDRTEKRDTTLLNLIKKFDELPKDSQAELSPLLNKTIRRHRDIKRRTKLCDYYMNNNDCSLNISTK